MKIISADWLLGFALIFLIKSTDSETAAPLKDALGSAEGQHSASEGSEVSLNYRLPNETYPEHYDIKITTDFHSGEQAFQGAVTIDIVVVTSTSSIVLHARQLEISNATIVNPSTGETEELSHDYESEREFVTFKQKSGQHFEAGTKWQLAISYHGQLQGFGGGFFSYKYVDESGKDRHVALTFFESSNARTAFPCYDEPGKRANFTITINHSPDFTAISNMPVNEKSSSAGKTVFLTTARIPPYVVGFVVCQFEYTEAIFDGMRHRVYSRSSEKHKHQLALVSGMLFTNYYAEYYGIDYMLTKIDHVAVLKYKKPAVESWGMPIYLEERSLYDKKTFFAFSETTAVKNIAHEVSHQWFGDYVTIQWWNDLWLKEGFATLLSYQAIENVFPDWSIWQDFHVIDYQRALSADASADSRTLATYVQKPSEIAAIYDELSFFKGASVLLMWQNALGKDVFRRGVQNFLKNNQYSAVTGDDLFIEMEKSAAADNLKLPASVTRMMRTWTHQSGHPILTVTRNYTDGSFAVKQEKFFLDANGQDNTTWYVPINFAVASNPNFDDTIATHYLSDKSETKVDAHLASGDWMILNKRSEYFYRIKYDRENYKLITQALIERPFQIHLRNRAQLLHDASYLTFSNRLGHEVLLEMMTYLKKEDQYAVWQTAISVISKYNNLSSLRDFRHFIVDLVGPIYKKLGVSNVLGEHRYDQYNRNNIIDIACRAEMGECLREVNKKLKDHLIRNVTIEKSLKEIIFSNGLIQADDEEFNIVYEQFMKSPDAGTRFPFIYYLSFAQNARHIKKFISSSIDMSNKLLKTERYSLLDWVYGKSEKSLLTCIEFLNDNWEAYGNLKEDGNGSDNILNSDIRGMSKFVFNNEVGEKLLALVGKVKESKYVSSSLESDVRKQIDTNYQWMRENGEPVLLWIRRYLRRQQSV